MKAAFQPQIVRSADKNAPKAKRRVATTVLAPDSGREKRFVCSEPGCKAALIVAYGYNALAITPERVALAAAKTGWTLNPERCPEHSNQ